MEHSVFNIKIQQLNGNLFKCFSNFFDEVQYQKLKQEIVQNLVNFVSNLAQKIMTDTEGHNGTIRHMQKVLECTSKVHVKEKEQLKKNNALLKQHLKEKNQTILQFQHSLFVQIEENQSSICKSIHFDQQKSNKDSVCVNNCSFSLENEFKNKYNFILDKNQNQIQENENEKEKEKQEIYCNLTQKLNKFSNFTNSLYSILRESVDNCSYINTTLMRWTLLFDVKNTLWESETILSLANNYSSSCDIDYIIFTYFPRYHSYLNKKKNEKQNKSILDDEEDDDSGISESDFFEIYDNEDEENQNNKQKDPFFQFLNSKGISFACLVEKLRNFEFLKISNNQEQLLQEISEQNLQQKQQNDEKNDLSLQILKFILQHWLINKEDISELIHKNFLEISNLNTNPYNSNEQRKQLFQLEIAKIPFSHNYFEVCEFVAYYRSELKSLVQEEIENIIKSLRYTLENENLALILHLILKYAVVDIFNEQEQESLKKEKNKKIYFGLQLDSVLNVFEIMSKKQSISEENKNNSFANFNDSMSSYSDENLSLMGYILKETERLNQDVKLVDLDEDVSFLAKAKLKQSDLLEQNIQKVKDGVKKIHSFVALLEQLPPAQSSKNAQLLQNLKAVCKEIETEFEEYEVKSKFLIPKMFTQCYRYLGENEFFINRGQLIEKIYNFVSMLRMTKFKIEESIRIRKQMAILKKMEKKRVQQKSPVKKKTTHFQPSHDSVSHTIEIQSQYQKQKLNQEISIRFLQENENLK